MKPNNSIINIYDVLFWIWLYWKRTWDWSTWFVFLYGLWHIYLYHKYIYITLLFIYLFILTCQWMLLCRLWHGLYAFFLYKWQTFPVCLTSDPYVFLGKAYAPEFYYDTYNSLWQNRPQVYSFKLQWTQMEPNAVDRILAYRLGIRQVSTIKPMNQHHISAFDQLFGYMFLTWVPICFVQKPCYIHLSTK